MAKDQAVLKATQLLDGVLEELVDDAFNFIRDHGGTIQESEVWAARRRRELEAARVTQLAKLRAWLAHDGESLQ
jgi:hypothetical protein